MTAIAERIPAKPVTTPAVTMAGALNRALADALSDDETVLVFGEDVGPLGGVFRVTDGLAATFGDARVFDTPLSESGIVGTAIGMAMNGLRPVVEMQFDAFAYPAFEQITSHLAKLRNRTRGRVALPVVIRIPYGGGIGGVEHHCDSSEAYYAHTAGLRVVTPATPGDAYALLRRAIECPDPVIFLEPKRRYWSKETTILDHAGTTLDRAIVRRPGSDVTLIAYGGTVGTALEAADAAAEEGRSVEVIDLRSLSPFDDETVTASVRRTGRAIVVHEASRFCGYGAEVAARLSEQCFHYLEAPVLRVDGVRHPLSPAAPGGIPPAQRGSHPRRDRQPAVAGDPPGREGGRLDARVPPAGSRRGPDRGRDRGLARAGRRHRHRRPTHRRGRDGQGGGRGPRAVRRPRHRAARPARRRGGRGTSPAHRGHRGSIRRARRRHVPGRPRRCRRERQRSHRLRHLQRAPSPSPGHAVIGSNPGAWLPCARYRGDGRQHRSAARAERPGARCLAAHQAARPERER